MKFNLIFVLLGLWTVDVSAQVRNYNDCTATAGGASTQRADLDTFCPRLEGANMEGCCPALYRQGQPLTCNYYVGSSQSVDQDGSYTDCVNNQNVQVACCATVQQTCGAQSIQKTFIPRLINRSNSCCFESCPNAQYWINPPNPDTRFTPQHLLGVITACGTNTGSCTAGLPACQGDNFCPVVTTAPPVGTPTSGPPTTAEPPPPPSTLAPPPPPG